ncbi:hypothetical protein CT0861_02266, partial [Colletotrichum tofieldiae]
MLPATELRGGIFAITEIARYPVLVLYNTTTIILYQRPIHQGRAEWCISEKTTERLLQIDVGIFLVALWTLALVWVAVLWVRDRVGCGHSGETVYLAAAAQEQGDSPSVIDERTPLLGGIFKAYNLKDESSSEVMMELRQVEVEKNRQAYAMLMGQESAYG